jgi:hypothetical protein
MENEHAVERIIRPKPLASLPRGRKRKVDGQPTLPVLELFVEYAKQTAGCCVCDRPIPKGTSRLLLKIGLPVPIINPDGSRRLTERYFAHPGCITDRVRPEVIRFGLDCYDCGLPPSKEESGYSYHPNRCYTVSKFSAAPLCLTCADKPRWFPCDVCSIWYPPWMVSELVTPTAVTPAVDVRNACQFCAQRFSLVTATDQASARAEFERLRGEILEHGFFGAGDDAEPV